MNFAFDRDGYEFLRDIKTSRDLKKCTKSEIELNQKECSEVEIRFGRDNKTFIPQISEIQFRRLYDYLSLHYKEQDIVHEESTIDILEDGNGENIRRISIRSPEEKLIFEKKKVIRDTRTIYKDFFIKIAHSIETPIDPIDRPIKMTRVRKRTSFNDEFLTYALTKVGLDTYEFEIEFKLYNNFDLTDIATQSIENILPLLVSPENKVNTYLPINTQTAVRESFKNLRIKEAKPVNISRQDIVPIRSSDYTVTNKLDGERFFIVFNIHGAHAVNERIVDKLTSKKFQSTSVLDTERFSEIFYTFDCMIYNGQDLTEKKHSERLTYAEKLVNNKIVIMKKFYDNVVSGTATLLREIDYNTNDGLIYTPNARYHSPDIYKWKFPEKMSIDFKVKKIEEGYNLYDYIEDTEKRHREPKDHLFVGSDKFPLIYGAIYESSEVLEENSIHEFTYDLTSSQFVRLRERPDKKRPNYCGVSMNVWNDIKNPFTKDELVALLDEPIESDIFKNMPPKEKLVCIELGKAYKEYHNQIKRGIIETYCENKNVLDLGIGRGGDIGKYQRVNIKKIFGVEPDTVNRKECDRRINETFKDMKDRITIIEGKAQDTDLIVSALVAHDTPTVDVISSFFSLSFFFFESSDLNSLVQTISSTLSNEGVFIGTTIDGERTEALLDTNNGMFTFKAGHMRWENGIKDSNKRVEVLLPGTIVKLQLESLVDFPLLSARLASRHIVLENSSFFEDSPKLTSEENILNSLYRTFTFRRKSPKNDDVDHILSEESDSGKTVMEAILKRLSTQKYKDCIEKFTKLCEFTRLTNDLYNIQVRFPGNDKQHFKGKIVKNTEEFSLGYFYANKSNGVNFMRTYGCIKNMQGDGDDYILVTGFPPGINHIPLCDWVVGIDSITDRENKYRSLISIISQIYQSLILLEKNGNTANSFMVYRNPNIAEIAYSTVKINVIDGMVVFLSNYSPVDRNKTFDLKSVLFCDPSVKIPFYMNGISRIQPSDCAANGFKDFMETIALSAVYKKYIDDVIDEDKNEKNEKDEPIPPIKKVSSRLPKKEEVKVERNDKPLQDIRLLFSTIHRSLRGFENDGNTCYINAALQSIVSAPPVMQYFCNSNIMNAVRNRDTRTNGKLVECFSELVCKLTTASIPNGDTIPAVKSREIRRLKEVMGGVDDRFAEGDQQDSGEFITALLSSLHEELNKNSNHPEIDKPEKENSENMMEWYKHGNNSFITELYHNQLKTTIICNHCGNRVERFGDADTILLGIPPNEAEDYMSAETTAKTTFDECMKLYTAQETQNDFKCSQCQQKGSTNSTSFSKPANVLIASFKRTISVPERVKGGKIEWNEKKIYSKISIPENMSIPTEMGEVRYKLYARIVQSGSSHGGHYFSFIKNGEEWYEYNDDDVHKRNRKEGDSYVVFYHRVE